MVDERVDFLVLVGVDDQTCGLIEQHDVFVLIDDLEPRRRDREIDILFTRRFKKLIVDVALQHVARAELLIPLGARTVDLDALQANVLLRKRGGEQGNGLAEKTVEPLIFVIFSDVKFPHGRHLRLHSARFSAIVR